MTGANPFLKKGRQETRVQASGAYRSSLADQLAPDPSPRRLDHGTAPNSGAVFVLAYEKEKHTENT
jgi:hypothetical protein